MEVVQYTVLLFLILNYVDNSNAIVGGSDAEDAEYPYLVSIQQNQNLVCGGAIIGTQWILTAAQCIAGLRPSQLTVVAGTNSLDGPGQRYNVETLIPHPDYYTNVESTGNDIGLMKLTQNISFSGKVESIKLPQDDTPSGRQLTLTGWGRTTYPGENAKTLQAINLTSITIPECSRYHPDVTSNNLCTKGDRGRGACHGDSGGPLVDGSSQVGILSYGRPCAAGFPDVFTRVYSYESWIRSNMV